MKEIKNLQQLYDIALEINEPKKILSAYRMLKPTKKVIKEFSYLYFNDKNNTPLKAVENMLKTLRKDYKKLISKQTTINEQIELPLYEAENYIIEYY